MEEEKENIRIDEQMSHAVILDYVLLLQFVSNFSIWKILQSAHDIANDDTNLLIVLITLMCLFQHRYTMSRREKYHLIALEGVLKILP